MDELSEHLDALARDGCYRVDAVMKESAFETTQLVYFVGANGSEQGPYVRLSLIHISPASCRSGWTPRGSPRA